MKTQSPILSGLKTLIFFIGLVTVTGTGACSVAVVFYKLVTVDTPETNELSFDTTVEELIKDCGPVEKVDENFSSWNDPKCVDGVRLEVIFNPRTRKLLSWKTYTSPKQFQIHGLQLRDSEIKQRSTNSGNLVNKQVKRNQEK